jgi:hypothetical protein
MHEERLAEKAGRFAEFLLHLISESGRTFYRSLVPNLREGDSLLFNLLTEEVFLHLHVVDRLAFQHLGDAGRGIFIDNLVPTVRETMLRDYVSGPKAAGFGTWFTEQFDVRQKEYAAFKYFAPEGDQPPKGTLFWEFAKNQCKMFPVPINPVDLLQVQLHEMHIMGALGLRELLEKQT